MGGKDIMLKDKIRNLYCELLGLNIKKRLIDNNICQNEISHYFYDEVKLISAPTISQILKGKRNITNDSVVALQDTLNLSNVKSIFFPDLIFCNLLLKKLIHFILTDDHFIGSTTRDLFKEKENVIQENISLLANELYSFFPDFPEEETSYQISDSLTDWLIEFVALVARL